MLPHLVFGLVHFKGALNIAHQRVHKSWGLSHLLSGLFTHRAQIPGNRTSTRSESQYNLTSNREESRSVEDYKATGTDRSVMST